MHQWKCARSAYLVSHWILWRKRGARGTLGRLRCTCRPAPSKFSALRMVRVAACLHRRAAAMAIAGLISHGVAQKWSEKLTSALLRPERIFSDCHPASPGSRQRILADPGRRCRVHPQARWIVALGHGLPHSPGPPGDPFDASARPSQPPTSRPPAG